ncbi:MAG: family peptidase, partial [Bacteroidetes bacterium]|nr:family peptidase [Bacteroidota bacterium]
RQVFFTGSGKNDGEDPYFIHYYRVNFDGSHLTLLTPEKANHEAVFSTDHRFLIDTWSTVSQPPITVLRTTDSNRIVMQVEQADISELLKAGWRAPEPFVTKGRDGKTDIWGNIYRPTNFDSTRKYPVVEFIYAGPQSSFAQKSFRPYVYFSGLAELGFVIVQMDGMGTSNRSKAFHDVCWKNLKDGGFPDRIIWIKAAADKYPFLDTSRVGIFGSSAGGQNAMAALLFHPEFYKAAVASCGCHDNRMDKIWWNEQFMGYPVGPQYAACSNVENAGKLKGNLLLLVGELDDNVDPASTMQVVNALIKANKDFELLVLPGMKHTGGGTYGERKRRDFFVRNLLELQPPDWNAMEPKEKPNHSTK